MNKIRRTFFIDKEIYDIFKQVCNRTRFKVSHKVQFLMEDEIRKEQR